MGNETRFIDLNEDCILLILEQSNFPVLLNVAQVNEQFSMLSADVFQRTKSHLLMVFRDEFRLPEDSNEVLNLTDLSLDIDTIKQVNEEVSHHRHDSTNIIISETQIELRTLDQLLNTFNHFRHVIKKFRYVTYSKTRPLHSKLIGKLINRYSFETLGDIDFEFNAEVLLEHITKPLANVKNLAFRYCDVNFSPKTIHLTEIFPAVRQLKFYSFTKSSIVDFDYHMPHLEHLSMGKTLWIIQIPKLI